MVDISSQNNKINVTVSSIGNTANTNVTPDYAQYYSEKSKEWATSNRIVDNIDYSSKYYANESKKQADISTAKATEVVESGNMALSNIDTAKNNAITSITNQETTSKTSLIDEGATQIGLIQNEGATQVANVQSTGQTEYNKIIATGIDNKVSKSGDTMTGALNIATKNDTVPIRLEMSGGQSSTPGIYINDIGFYYNGERTALIRANHKDTFDSLQLSIINESGSHSGVLSVSRNHTTQKDEVSILGKSLAAFIISTYVNGTSGYRIWSDGYCEQWGRTVSPSVNYVGTINFVKSFKNTQYTFVKQYFGSYDGTWSAKYESVRSMTNNSVTTWFGGTDETYLWKACGYLAEGEY